MGRLVCLLGGACVGKDTVRSIMLEKHSSKFVSAISHTTRPIRATEKGDEYYFIDDAEFLAMYENGEFLETRTYSIANGDIWYYGYSINEVNSCLAKKDVLMIVDLQGFKEFKAIYGNQCIGIYIAVSRDIRIKRYLERDELTWENVTEAVRRILDDDERAFNGYEKWVDKIIYTNESDFTVKEVEHFLGL